MTTARDLDTWNDSQEGDGDSATELLVIIREMEEALGWYTSFYHDVQRTAPEYFERCADLNATQYLYTEAQGIRDRALMLLDQYEAPAPETEPDYEDLPL